MQTKKHSLIEAVVNVSIGYIVAILSQMAIYPLFNIRTSTKENMLLALFFTLVSLVRSYCLRRFFNTLTYKKLNP